jgi:hypothetical protein
LRRTKVTAVLTPSVQCFSNPLVLLTQASCDSTSQFPSPATFFAVAGPRQPERKFACSETDHRPGQTLACGLFYKAEAYTLGTMH